MPPNQQLHFNLFGTPEPPPSAPSPPLLPPLPTPAAPTAPPTPPRDPLIPAAALAHQARSHATRLGLHDLAATLNVRWNPRLRTTAGRAYRNENRIELNPALGSIDTSIEETERTLLHELAHLIAYTRAGRRRIEAHGPEWRQACADIGIAGESRTHTLALAPSRKIRRKYAYRCPSCGEVVLRVKRFQRYSACFPCCKKHNAGRYHERFQFTPVPLEDAERYLAATENGQRK
ncbi:MAG: SprT-like domain-containing protein [Verrucomicrobiales bacterium]|nr:SprT-like domain-containing protein [Verrucomicrobiales bacterium]